MKNKKETGKLGEKIAENYLEAKGYQILEKNYFLKAEGSPFLGEIDIIAKKEETICFVEVKTLVGSLSTGFVEDFSPEQRVNFEKRKKIARVAEMWLAKNKIPLDSNWQIDLLSIVLDPQGKKAKIKHFQNI